MKEYKTFMDLTVDDIRFIVDKIFSPKKITRIKKHAREKYIACNIYTEWNCKDDNGKIVTQTICDELELYDPYSFNPFKIDLLMSPEDTILYRQFCYSKEIYPDWINDNPFTKRSENNGFSKN